MMTTDEIMALADEYGARHLPALWGDEIEELEQARAALRAAVEQIVADRDRWRQIGETQSDSIYRMSVERAACDKYLKEGETPAERMERDHRDSLALMGLLAKEKERAERAEQEALAAKHDATVAKSACLALGDRWDETISRANKAEAERDALRALLKRQEIYTGNGGWTTLTDAQIDAALESMK